MSARHSKRLRAVAYYRMSSDDQEGSVEQQQEWARPTAEKENVEIAAEFTDAGKKGHDTAKRAAFHRMLAYCQDEHEKGRDVDAIVCWDANRFSRSDSQETGWYIWEFRKVGVNLMLTSSNGWIDFRDDTDRLVFNITQDTSNHKYVKNLAKDVLRGKITNARNGFWNGGRPPFGYRAVPEVVAVADTGDGKRKRRYRVRLVPDEVTAPIVRELFRRLNTGTESLSSLCRWLDTTGVRPARAKSEKAYWHTQVVRRILSSETYLGDLLYGRERKGKFFCLVDGRPVEPGKAGEKATPGRRPNNHEPLIDRETFDTAQVLLAAFKSRSAGPTSRKVFPLLGLLICAHCGSKMSGHNYQCRSGGKRSRLVGQTFFRCGRYADMGKLSGCHCNSVHERSLLVAILRKLKERLLNEDVLERLRAVLQERARVGRKATVQTRRSLELDRDRLQRELDRASQRFLVEEDERLATLYRKTLNELQERKDDIERRLAEERLTTGTGTEADPDAVIERALSIARRLDTSLANADPARLRLALLQVIERVEVSFRHEQKPQRTLCHFSRAVVFLYPGLLADLLELDTLSPTSASTDVSTDVQTGRRYLVIEAVDIELQR